MFENVAKGAKIFVGILIIAFILGVLSLGWTKFFKPKQENIRREVFEQTQSYVHGKIQDLAKYYGEYEKADTNDRETIQQLIIVRFAEFDESKIKSPGLKRFLTTMRGY